MVLSFDYAAYMVERMDSVLAQTHPVREIIVLDDASTDASVERARSAAAARRRQVEVIVSAVNSGNPFAQWREAARRAGGEWLWIAEADDAAEPRFLQALAERLTCVPDAVLGFTDSRVVDQSGKPTPRATRPTTGNPTARSCAATACTTDRTSSSPVSPNAT